MQVSDAVVDAPSAAAKTTEPPGALSGRASLSSVSALITALPLLAAYLRASHGLVLGAALGFVLGFVCMLGFVTVVNAFFR